MTTLLDSNVLIALVVADHVHHSAAEAWLVQVPQRFATCPITQGSLVRLLLRKGQSTGLAHALLAALSEDRRHEFWPDTLSYLDVPLTGVVGHRQVTDAYLAQLARTRGGRLATFDLGLAQLHRDVGDVVPTNMAT